MDQSHALLRLLEGDLRALSEVKDVARKYPDVKEAAERALFKLRSVSKSLPAAAGTAEQAEAVAAADDDNSVMLVPFMLALASKSDALPLSALGAVQRMISHNCVAPQRLTTVTSQLIARAQQPTADESSLLKVLQTVLTIASSPALLFSDTTVSQLLLLCLTLQQNRSVTIKNTASATVQQFVALLLDAVAAEGVAAPAASEASGASGAASADAEAPLMPGPGESLPTPTQAELAALSVAARCAFMAVQDLCLLANGEPALWLPGSGPVSVPFAFEVINRTLVSHQTLFTTLPPFRFLLRERACALVLRNAKKPTLEWASALRLADLTSTLLSKYARTLRHETETLLSALAKTATTESQPIWQRALSLEACRVVAADPGLLRALFVTYDCRPASSNLFTTFCAAMCGLLKSPSVAFQPHAEYIESHFLRHHRAAFAGRAPTFNVALYSDADSSHLTNDYTAALAVECQVYLARAFGSFGETLRPAEEDAGAEDARSRTATERDVQAGVVRDMVGSCWKPLLGALSLLMATFGREEAVQAVLKCYQAFTQACGVLGLKQPRDAFLTSLCHYALPPRPREKLHEASGSISFSPADTAYEPLPHTRLSAKNVLALKAVFNIAHCMGGLLGASWSLVLDAFEQLDRIIASSKTTAPGGSRAVELATAIGGPEATSNELSILSAALDNLFSGSARLDDTAISHFLTALSTSCFASLAHEATSKEKIATPGSAAAQAPRLFALSKFVDTVLVNMGRVEVLWPLVTQFLLPVANHQTLRIRLLGIESLAKVVTAAMRHHISEKDTAARTGAPPPPPARAPVVGATLAGEGEGGGGWDRVLLAPLEELQRRCTYRETQERILASTHEILMVCGAGLTDGWLLVLSILWRAATKPSLVPLLPLAFRSVQLIASDFLPLLPAACLPAYVEVAAAFATQPNHLNVSLTAVGLQWTIGDQMFSNARRDSGAAREDEDDTEEAWEEDGSEDYGDARDSRAGELRSPGTAAAESAESEQAQEEGNGSANASAARYAKLSMDAPLDTHYVWCAITRQLRRLCVDSRPEVRTCTLHTLVSIVSSHGDKISGRSWDHLIRHTLLPLTREVVAKSGSASDESVAKKLGTEGGKDVVMTMHHSRDTLAKQWNETWVLALGSAARIYRAFLPQLSRRKTFSKAWEALLAFVQTSLLALPRSAEVAYAAIGACHSLLLSSQSRAQRASGQSLLNPPTMSASDANGNAPIPVAAPLSPQRPIAAPAAASPYATAAPTRSGDGLMTTPAAGGGSAERERLPPRLWASVWAVVERAVETATRDATAFRTHEKMLCALLSRTADLYDGARPLFEEADVLRMLQLAERLARFPEGTQGWDPTQPSTAPTDIQKAILELLEKLPPFAANVRSDEMWPLLLWLLLKLIEPPPAHAPALDGGAEVSAPAPASAPKASQRVVVGFAEKCYALLHRLVTEQAGAAAKLAVAEDVLNVMRGVMSWRLHPACRCPSLPRAAANGFVGLLHALLPHLPPAEEGAARRAHAELIEALWVRIAPPATRSVAGPGSLQGQDSPLHRGDSPGMAKPLSYYLPLSSQGSGEDEQLTPPPPLPVDAGEEALELASTTLAAARLVLLSTSMRPALRRRLLQLPCAVLVLPAKAAVRSDECWRNAASTLCMLSGTSEGGNSAGSGGPCASLAAPMLVDAAAAVLTSWSHADGGDLGETVGPRAAQMAHLLSLLGALSLPEGVLPDASGAQASAAAAPSGSGKGGGGATRSGRRAHLLRLAPCLIECIGQPTEVYANGPIPPSVTEMAAATRRLLHLVASELNLE